jgi:hypothetical protein
MIDELLDAPRAAFAAVMGLVGHFLGLLTPVWALLGDPSVWFTPVSLFAGIVAPNIEWIPTDAATQVLVAAALLYIAHYLWRQLRSYQA